MDDAELVTSFLARETQRINQTLKDMYSRPQPPTEEEKNAILSDIEKTLARLQSAVLHLGNSMAASNMEETSDDE